MGTIRLSYIVPVYNTLAWLRDCLDSLLGHQGTDVEFILVDDGSTDGSSELLQHYANEDSRIKLIRQENKGLSAARNIGLANAVGQYILFVDSDDIVDSDAVIRMVETAEKEDADIVTGQIMCLYENGIKSPWGKFLQDGIYDTGFDYMKAINSVTYVPMVFGYMFRRELPMKHALAFMPDLIHEDELWTPRLLARVQKVIVKEQVHYFYRINRNGSIISAKDSVKRSRSLAIIIHALIDDCVHLLASYKEISAQFLPFYLRRITALVIMLKEEESSEDVNIQNLNAKEYYFRFIFNLKNHMIDNKSIMEYLHQCFDYK